MRTLSDENRGLELVNRQKVNELSVKVEGLEVDVNNQKADVSKVKADVGTLEVKVDSLNNEVKTKNVKADKADVTAINANTAKLSTLKVVNSAEITNVSAENVNTHSATIGTLGTNDVNASGKIVSDKLETNEAVIGLFHINNLTSDKVETSEVDSTTVVADSISADNVHIEHNIEAESLTAEAGNISTLETESIKSNNIDTDKAVADDFISADIHFEKYHIQQPDPSGTETKYLVIKIPKFTTGFYRTEYRDNEGNMLFSMTVSNASNNVSFSYSRADDTRSMEEVKIKDGDIYVKTWYGGVLYYQNNSIQSVSGPASYSDYPFDINDADYKYTCSRRNATVYTEYLGSVNLTGDGEVPLGSGLLSINATRNVEDVENVYEYDSNQDVVVHTYRPDQDVSSDCEVIFESVDTKDAIIQNLTVKDGLGGQYLRQAGDGTKLDWESPETRSDVGYISDSSSLVEAKAISNWDGSTQKTVDGETVVEKNITKLGTVTEGEWKAGDIDINGNIKAANIDTTGNVHISGDLTVDGKTTTVHTEEVVTDSDTITLRHEATTAIQPGKCSGIEIENYDGNGTTLQLAVDKDGTLRIGTDIGTSGGNNEPILTRAESSALTNNRILVWDNVNSRAVDGGKTIADLTPVFKIYRYADITSTASQSVATVAARLPNNSVLIDSANRFSNQPTNNFPGIVVIYKDSVGRLRAVNYGKNKSFGNWEMWEEDGSYNLDDVWVPMGSFMNRSGLTLNGSGDIGQTTPYPNTAGTLCIGTPTGVHIEMDGNEIITKATDTTLGTTYLHGTFDMSGSDCHLKVGTKSASSVTTDGEIFIIQ